MTGALEGNTRVPFLDIGISTIPMKGETESGDRCCVRFSGHTCLVAAIDGLGHGSEAGYASAKAVEVLEGSNGESLMALINRCHERLLETRGAVLGIARFDVLDETLTWLGVGNIEGIVFRSDASADPRYEQMPTRGGVVGYKLPQLFASVLPIKSGDTMILVTDGIRSDFAAGVNPLRPVLEIAESIGTRYGRGNDDALVVIARYLGTNR